MRVSPTESISAFRPPKPRERQSSLLSGMPRECALPADYEPHPPPHLQVERIIFAKGSLSTPERRHFVERIVALYPEAEKIECPDIPHNRISLGPSGSLALHRAGKRTLLFGELESSVRFSEESRNACPNYWHFSPYGFCPYGCTYCYLAGTRGVWHSPSVKIFLNLAEILRKIDRIARLLRRETSFYLGKLQDPLALDPLTAYSTVLIPFFARHEHARQVLLTKSAHVERLLPLHHANHTILSWSLNPPEVVQAWEENVPSIPARLEAIRRCAARGYPIRAVIMPIIPIENWQNAYTRFLRQLLSAAPIQRLTLGGICIYPCARSLMESKLGRANLISRLLADRPSPDGRTRYPQKLRLEIYSHLIRIARELQPEIQLALCLEEPVIWKALGLEANLGRCNCLW